MGLLELAASFASERSMLRSLLGMESCAALAGTPSAAAVAARRALAFYGGVAAVALWLRAPRHA